MIKGDLPWLTTQQCNIKLFSLKRGSLTQRDDRIGFMMMIYMIFYRTQITIRWDAEMESNFESLSRLTKSEVINKMLAANIRISELEEAVEDANAALFRMTEGCPVDWKVED